MKPIRRDILRRQKRVEPTDAELKFNKSVVYFANNGKTISEICQILGMQSTIVIRIIRDNEDKLLDKNYLPGRRWPSSRKMVDPISGIT